MASSSRSPSCRNPAAPAALARGHRARLAEAIALHRAGRVAQAAAMYRGVLKSAPADALALSGLGAAELQLGRPAAAEVLLRRALRASAADASILCNLGLALVRQGRREQGADCLSRAIRLRPDFAQAWSNRAAVLLELGRAAEALDDATRAGQLDPGDAAAQHNRGNALLALDRPLDAVAAYDRAVTLDPGHADAHNNRGNALRGLGRFAEALDAYDAALGACPDHAGAHSNRGNALCDLGRVDEAMAAFDRAFDLAPDQARAYGSRGNAMLILGRLDEAMRNYERVSALDPDDAAGEFNQGLLCLLRGDLVRGWRLYEARWARTGRSSADPEIRSPRQLPRPLWLGEQPIAGRRLFVHAEQGLGDMIQFCRYVEELVRRGAQVQLEVPGPLLGLMRSLPWPVTLVEKGAMPTPFDLHCPLMSLPLALGTTLETIPAPIPYLGVDPVRRERWRQHLGPAQRMRVGLAWSGSSGHRNDHNRSLALARLAPLFELPVEFHCMHKEIRQTDLGALAGLPLLRHDARIDDFADTAALVEQMDAVVSVDTSVAHLAGALGRPTWLLLPFVPDWRWMLDRDDSPWYPGMTLLRQSRLGDWGPVLERLGREIAGQHTTGRDTSRRDTPRIDAETAVRAGADVDR